ncbi:MAG: amidohydrolase family protein [Alphaproteobacteria bacterium]|nr:amidohydrolase family protein [Alphaproteobacteria bacterium]
MAKRPARGTSPIIDFHTHINMPEVQAWIKDNARGPNRPRPRVSRQSAAFQRRQDATVQSRSTDMRARIRDMDRAGIDIQVLSAHLTHFCYWAPARKGLEVAKIFNDRAAEIAGAHPDRFVCLATVPLQAPKLAVRELERAIGLGHRGVEISSRTEDKELGDPVLEPFWEAAAASGLPVYIHPHGFTSTERMQAFFLWNSIAQPLEEAMAMSSIIYSGLLDRYPRLKIVIAHGGGFLPYYAGRVDRAFEVRPETRANIDRKPSAYMRKFYYDTCVYNADMLQYLAGKVGAGRIIMGSDYPVFLKEPDPIGFVKKVRGLKAEQKRNILGGTAARLLKL